MFEQIFDCGETSRNRVNIGHQILKAYHLFVIYVCFSPNFISQSTIFDLFAQNFRSHYLTHFLDYRRQVDLLTEGLIFVQELILEGLKLLFCSNTDLDFDLVPNTKLVLDVLRSAKAPENTTTNHNAHLCRQSLRFFH